MAVWHFQVALIPAGSLPPIETNERLDCLASWRGVIKPDWEAIVSGILQKNKPWSPQVDTWGVSDTLQLYVLHNRGQMEDAFLRIDVRQEIGSILNTLLARLRAAGLMFAFSNSDICEVSRHELDSRLKLSLAFVRFKKQRL